MTRSVMTSLLTVLLGCVISVSASAAPSAELWSVWDSADDTNTAVIDHSSWRQLLNKYLVTNHPSGVNRFNYAKAANADEPLLADYIQELADIDPRDYAKPEQKAYWINLYNALTVQVIVDEYPVKTIKKTGDSFFNIFGPWDDKLIEVAGEELSLNDIEHRILRPIWQDPRLHFAVNCASIGCPNLQSQPFTAANTEIMLSKAANEYLSHSRGAKFDREGRLVLSQIFEWYGVDFGADEKSMIDAISHYAPSELAKKMRSYKGKVVYEYDWGLNGL